MNEIRELCQKYNEHLSYFDDKERDCSDQVGYMKKQIVIYLLEKNNPQDILSLLGTQTSALKLTKLPQYANSISYEQILRVRRSSWLRNILFGVLLVLTLPISVPFLMIWSRITRGDINFFKPDGAIFVEKLRFLCKQAGAKEGAGVSPAANDRTEVRVTLMDDYKSLIPRLKSDGIVQAPTQNPNGLFKSMFGSICNNEMDRRDSGNPELLSYRIRPFRYSEAEVMEIDIFSGFKYIPNEVQGRSLKLRFDLKPECLRVQANRQESLLVATEVAVNPPNSIAGFIQSSYSYFFTKPAATFETVVAAMKKGRYIDISKPYYELAWKALALARNDMQRIQILEPMINMLKSRYDHYCKYKLKTEERVVIYQKNIEELERVTAWGFEPSDAREASHAELCKIRNKEIPFEPELSEAQSAIPRLVQEMDAALAELNRALEALPVGYHRISPSANELQRKIDLIFQMLEENRIGDAEILHRDLPKITYFLEVAFPHLMALLEQFKGMFCLVRQSGAYRFLELDDEPSDTRLLKTHLMIYYKANELWVAFRNPDGEAQRIPIDNAKYGDKASSVASDFAWAHDIGSIDNRNYAYRVPLAYALAEYGYYEEMEESIVAASKYFMKAYEKIQTYDTALAQRFKLETLGPLDDLKKIGLMLKNNTPLPIQDRMIAQLTEESREEMLCWELSVKQPSLLSNETWDEILVDAETPQYKDTARKSSVTLL